MITSVSRIFFLLLSGGVGLYLFFKESVGILEEESFLIYVIPAMGLLVGLGVGAAVLLLEHKLEKVSGEAILGGGLGFLGGIGTAAVIAFVTGPLFPHEALSLGWKVFVLLVLSYLGLALGSRLGQEAGFVFSGQRAGKGVGEGNYKILDTSVIIDGRIADLCETGFLDGVFLTPQFILKELQHIADSSDPLKRARGRRGLDILNRMQKMAHIAVRIVEEDFPQIREVDGKIVALAKKMEAKVITNDLNLNKVAELQGVKVLNINELCNALKPVVLPGESMKVFVLKEGKEPGQGVAYLDDGTMIVVDEGKRCIGRNVDVVVTSVLQTTAGRMIFTRLKEESEREEAPHYVKG